MAFNEQNLIPFNKRTEKEKREIAIKGGKASGIARKEKATMKKTLEMLLDSKNNKGKTYRDLTTLGLIKGAVDGKAENYKIILQLLGELEQEQVSTPTLKIEVVNNEDLEGTLYDSDN